MLETLGKLIKINEATAYVGRGRSKIYELIGTGELRAVRVGGRIYTEESEIRRFREANTRPVQPKRPQAVA